MKLVFNSQMVQLFLHLVYYLIQNGIPFQIAWSFHGTQECKQCVQRLGYFRVVEQEYVLRSRTSKEISLEVCAIALYFAFALDQATKLCILMLQAFLPRRCNALCWPFYLKVILSNLISEAFHHEMTILLKQYTSSFLSKHYTSSWISVYVSKYPDSSIPM